MKQKRKTQRRVAEKKPKRRIASCFMVCEPQPKTFKEGQKCRNCNARLNRYNPYDICAPCQDKGVEPRLRKSVKNKDVCFTIMVPRHSLAAVRELLREDNKA